MEQSLADFRGKPGGINFELLEIKVKNAISEGRNLLRPFHADSTGPLLEFLEKCLPQEELGKRLQRGLNILAKEQPEQRKRATSELIREAQAALTQLINERLAKLSGRTPGVKVGASAKGVSSQGPNLQPMVD